jgi:hypothetical protein
MLFRLDSGQDCRDFSIGMNDERSPFDPHVLLAVHALFLEHVEFFGQVLVHVGQQRVRQLVLLFKFFLR